VGHPVGLNLKKVIEMPRKCVVKVVLSKEQKEILNELARRLGTSESETLRMALMDYVKELSLMRESIHRNQNQI
jgi:predicted DNA-binding protein